MLLVMSLSQRRAGMRIGLCLLCCFIAVLLVALLPTPVLSADQATSAVDAKASIDQVAPDQAKHYTKICNGKTCQLLEVPAAAIIKERSKVVIAHVPAQPTVPVPAVKPDQAKPDQAKPDQAKTAVTKMPVRRLLKISTAPIRFGAVHLKLHRAHRLGSSCDCP